MRAAPGAELKPMEQPLDRAAFLTEVEAWARKLGVRPKVVQVRPMKREWGSCSSKGRVSFSTELLRQPAEFRRRVIVEELLHLRVPGHGRLFRALLKAYLARNT